MTQSESFSILQSLGYSLQQCREIEQFAGDDLGDVVSASKDKRKLVARGLYDRARQAQAKLIEDEKAVVGEE